MTSSARLLANKLVANEIQDKAFMKHPSLIKHPELKYFFQKLVRELDDGVWCADFHRGICPDDITIHQTYYEDEFTICIDNCEVMSICITDYGNLTEEVCDYIKDNLHYFSPRLLLDNIKPEKRVKAVYFSDDEEEEEEEEELPDKIYENQTCPVCFDNYDEDKVEKVLKCGHMLCKGCYASIYQQIVSRCPECRSTIDKTVTTQSGEEEYWSIEEIDELCQEGNLNALLDLIDVDGVVEERIMRDGYNVLDRYREIIECDDYMVLAVLIN
jgi:hypothetical protein